VNKNDQGSLKIKEYGRRIDDYKEMRSGNIKEVITKQ